MPPTCKNSCLSSVNGRLVPRLLQRLVELGVSHAEPLDFTKFFSECAPRLHRWIARRCGSDKTLAEDLVQEVFTQAWKNWERVGCYENPHAWVFLVARQMVARYHRSRAKLADVVPDIRDHLIGDTDGLVDFTRALPHLSLEHRRVAFLVFALEYTPLASSASMSTVMTPKKLTFSLRAGEMRARSTSSPARMPSPS
jgi:RNA polymerase sigma factor (sigma-70 family)